MISEIQALFGQHFHPRELRYPANWLSFLRLLLIPLAGACMRRPEGRRKALLISAVAMSTDLFDGVLARSRGEVSNLGKVLDPIADKLFINSIASALSQQGQLPRWVYRALVLRDLAIIVGSMVLFKRHSHLAVSKLPGKISTSLLMGSMLLYMINLPRWGRRLLNLSLGPLALSIIQYGYTYLRIARATEGTVEA